MTTLQWSMDERTAKAAAAHPFPIKRDSPAAQFGGCLTAFFWQSRKVLSSETKLIP
jgi:hypothetical protein